MPGSSPHVEVSMRNKIVSLIVVAGAAALAGCAHAPSPLDRVAVAYSTIKNSHTLNPGIYVITSDITLSGNDLITGTGVMLYFGCSNYPTPCTVGQTGAGITATGNGSMRLKPITEETTGFNRIAGELVKFDNRPFGELEHILDKHARSTQLDFNVQLDIAQQFDARRLRVAHHLLKTGHLKGCSIRKRSGGT